MLRVSLFIFSLGLLAIAADVPYSCTGVNSCSSDCTSTTIDCILEGSVSGPTSCKTTATANSIKCEVYQGTNLIAETETDCIGCNGSGSGGTGGGPDPQYCSLNWWLRDPWSM